MSFVFQTEDKISNINFNVIQGFLLDLLNYDEITFKSEANPNVETILTHKLGRVPKGYYVVKTDIGGMLRDGDTAWDKTTISVKSSIGGTNYIVRII